MINKSIAIVIKTDGLEYDDRVRKEIVSIKKLFPGVTFKAFVMLPENKEIEGTTGYGIPYKSVYIPARDKYPSSKKKLLKSFEFYKVVKNDIRKYDVVWAANVDAAFVPLLSTNKNILWDLHEVPSLFLGNAISRFVLKYIYNRCRVVLHANIQRIQYLQSLKVIDDPSKHFALRNYPNFEDVDNEYDDTYHAFINWKRDSKCVYLQGLEMDRRAPIESISAIMLIPDLKAVIVGKFNSDIRKFLEQKYGDSLSERVMFTGMIPQLKIPQYVKQCYISLVFYKNVNPNNYHCEANRLYQSIIMGLPVVVGSNPSMKELVERFGFGVAINDDGSNIDSIISGIHKVIENYDYYKQNNIKYRDRLLWESQESIIENFMKRLFSE